MSTPLQNRGARNVGRAQAGFTFVELVIVMAILATAMTIFTSAVLAVSGEQAVNRENGIAANGTRNFIETLRSEDMRRVFARYNTDDADDPGGAGSAPGSRFTVEGLDPGSALDGMVGEVFFPSINVALGTDPVDLELREDVANARLGTPRDLNGDSIIDGADHTLDYLILPLEVVLRWEGKSGTRELRTFATLCQFNWE